MEKQSITKKPCIVKPKKKNKTLHPAKFPPGCRSDLFVIFPDEIIRGPLFKEVSKPGISHLFIIYKYSDRKGKAYPGQATISEFGGISVRALQIGAVELDNFPKIFLRNSSQSQRGNDYITYLIKKAPKKDSKIEPQMEGSVSWDIKPRKHLFIFHDFVNGKNWACLSHVGRNLYLSLKWFCGWAAWEEEEYTGKPAVDSFEDRQYDFVTLDPSGIKRVCKQANIHRTAFWGGIRSLMDCGFLEDFGIIGGRRVFLLPRRPIFCFLNQIEKEKLASQIEKEKEAKAKNRVPAWV